jgi:valyl-tRNA synthetase
MQTELAKTYDPAGVEDRWYAWWLERGFFEGRTGASGRPFSMVIPPPNITGALHMGHALNNTLQDILVRRARMQGRPTLWIPGTDHAAIATQNVIERRLAAEGLSRFDIGREAFEARFWEWKNEYESRILGQLRRLGASCDWSRTRFTMDEGLSSAVRRVFVRLYEEGRIYRGNRIINWCPRCTSAISDIEVKHLETPGELIWLRYPLTDSSGHITVVTSRVETTLGDTAVAVHPEDERYSGLAGRSVRLPITGRDVPIVADRSVDPEFGTGAVKVTPAHDPGDFEIAQRWSLPAINVLDETAAVNGNGGDFAGLSRYEARRAVLERLRSLGAVEKEERPYIHAVGHCDRCETEIEPWLSEQWFVAMKDLAAPAIEAVREGRVRIHPSRFEKVYFDWMSGIRDWCISRQLWLGHRIPVWYCEQGHQTVSIQDPSTCATCASERIEQDPDTLDTWFSSQLWPFSTLGWPESTDDLDYWYPTSVLVTAYEILFLWVSRMIMSGLHFRSEVPFRHVVVHGIVRDFEGKKMSKSLGNTIDPLDLMERYGTDALRFSLARTAVPGQDTNVSEEWIEGDRRFCNKLWNAARFVMSNLDTFVPRPEPIESAGLGLAERWILSRLAQTRVAVDGALESFDFAEAARSLHHFVWSELCDWYLEMAKLALQTGRADKSRAVLYHVLESSLRLAHPMMPFITEEIWQRLPRRPGDPESIVLTPWPPGDPGAIDTGAEEDMDFVQQIVVEVRRFRHEHGIGPGRRLDAVVLAPGRWSSLAWENLDSVKALARLGDVRVGGEVPRSGWSKVVAGHAEVYLPLEASDTEAETVRLEREIRQAEDAAARARQKLRNEGFVSGAPDKVVEQVRAQLAAAEARIGKLRAQLRELAH